MNCDLTHIRWSLTFVAVVTFFSTFAHSAKAQTSEASFTPTKYQFTMTKLEMCHSSACTSPFMLGNSSAVFDIGSAVADPAAQVGSYVGSVTMKTGETYTHIRATMNRSFTLTGGGASGDFTGTAKCFTDENGTAADEDSLASTTDADASGDGGVASSMTMFVPAVNGGGDYGDLTTTYTTEGISIVDATTFQFLIALTGSYTVGTSSPTVTISFDVSSTLEMKGTGADACDIWFLAPSVTISITG